MLISAAIQAAAKGGSAALASKAEKKMQKRKSRESERETHAGLLQDTLQRGAELEGQKLQGRKNLGKAKIKNHFDTADIVRGALNL